MAASAVTDSGSASLCCVNVLVRAGVSEGHARKCFTDPTAKVAPKCGFIPTEFPHSGSGTLQHLSNFAHLFAS